ncbi:MAG: PD-(D/E)XK nuclease family protein [Rhizobium sp.]|nr:MAG: PD-(D/E)XK nuclease family protein [Rhizobium sp.]
MKLYLSHSAISKYEACPEQYRLHYVERLGVRETSSNLVFGSAIDKTIKEIIEGIYHGNEVDGGERFEATFADLTSREAVQYGRLKKADLQKIGSEMMKKFPIVWNRIGHQPLVLPNGKLMMDLELATTLPDGTVLKGVLDIAAVTPEAEVAIEDFKGVASRSAEVVTDMNDQLTSYQLLVEANRKTLGIDSVDKLGFMELVKNKTPVVEEPYLVAPRSPKQLHDYQQKVMWVADDIRKGRFPKRPMNAYNTPCSMCDFVKLCSKGDKSGLHVRPKRKTDDAVPAAA